MKCLSIAMFLILLSPAISFAGESWVSMKMLSILVVFMLSLASVSRASLDDADYISQLGYATTMVPVVIISLPVAPTILGFATTFSPDRIARKLIIEAQEDVAYFVASEGAVRTARFDQVVQHLRENAKVGELFDFEIAQIALAIGAR